MKQATIENFSGASARGEGGSVSFLAREGLQRLIRDDAGLYDLMQREHDRQLRTLSMVASASVADPSVLLCHASAIGNLTTEGYPGHRFHTGCTVADEIEALAIARSKQAFGAAYANVQPHSGTSANQIAMVSLLDAGDTILGMDLKSGGHLTHGAKASYSGRYFNSIGYGVDPEGFIDYEAVEKLAKLHRPRLIVCGASAYPRTIDFKRFRAIADEVEALLLADISHIAGLVATGEHPSPIDCSHLVTTSTYKQLFGPRGGLILVGQDHAVRNPRGKGTLADAIQSGVFPFFQGTPNLDAILGKARALHRICSPQFKELCKSIVSNAREIAACLTSLGYRVLTGGTDNHTVLVSVVEKGMTGRVVEKVLEECGILVNRNLISGDTRPPTICSGIRIGTNTLSARGMRRKEMRRCVELLDWAMTSATVQGDAQGELPQQTKFAIRAEVEALCEEYPLPGYTPTATRLV
jgi:glycine hydroxymethyltransferase